MRVAMGTGAPVGGPSLVQAAPPAKERAMPPRRYLDFDLLLEQQADGDYQALVTGSPLGEVTSQQFRLPFGAQDLELLLLKLDPGRSGTRRVGASSQQQAAMDFGGPLFDALFRDDVGLAWSRSQDLSRQQDAGLRLRLRLTGAPAIAGMPWELLYDRRNNSFPAQSERTPLVRYLDVPHVPRPMPVDGPLRVLAIISSPTDMELLDVEAEWERLGESLADRMRSGQVVLDRLSQPRLSELGPWLRRHQTHVVHFVGHGDFDERLEEGVLYFQDKLGARTPVTSAVLGPYLRDHDPLRLVVLNACRSARTDAVDPFGGIAQGLVQQDATAVVAMQFPISDRAAVVFTGDFYGSLADGLPVDQSVTSARKALLAEFRDEWATPVLFMRAPDGAIFDNVVAETPVVHDSAPPPSVTAPPTDPTHAAGGAGGARDGPPAASSARRRRALAAAGAALVLAAVTTVVIVLTRGDGGDEGRTTTPDASVSESPAADGAEGEGDALAGSWAGTALVSGGSRFDVRLDVATPCRLGQPCGTIFVSSLPCEGRASLASVAGRTFEFHVDNFTPDSSSDCTSGGGDFFELVDDGTLRYTTDYADIEGVLDKVG